MTKSRGNYYSVPKGNKCGSKSSKGIHLSIYLGVHYVASLSDNWKVYTTFKLRLKSQGIESDIEKGNSVSLHHMKVMSPFNIFYKD
ncbi:hypothetical protein HanIR_Chr11g0515521 [Helianthus annuus]|nr:hypothetical protein HanIR_Chr11g0515521 [Helianthus annuus]